MSEATEGQPPRNQLRRGTLGLGMIVFFVVSAAGPMLGLAGGFPVAIMFGTGLGQPLMLLAAMILLLMFSVGYTAMAKEVTSAGGFYSFIAKGLGGRAGGAAGMVAVLGYNAVQFGLYGIFGIAVGQALGPLGIDLPWWAYAAVAWALVAVMGYRKIDLSAKVLGILVIGEYGIVLLLDILILLKGGAHGLTLKPFTFGSLSTGSLSLGLLMCLGAFLGFEATIIYGEEAKNPHKTIPLATYLSVILIGLFFVFSAWCLIIGKGYDELLPFLQELGPDAAGFMFILGGEYAGPWLPMTFGFFLVTSAFAALLATHNAAARYFFALGREGILPTPLSATHDKFHSPHIGSLLQSVLALIVVAVFAILGADPLLNLFAWLINLCTLAVLALMAVASLAIFMYFLRHEESKVGGLTLLLSLVSGLLLAAVTVAAALNFDALTGATPAVAWILVGLVPVAAAIGYLKASSLKNTQPELFLRLGQSHV